MNKNLYTYKGMVKNVVDGDTFDIVVDLGFGIKVTQRFRLARIDTPEIRGEERPEGLKVKYIVENLILGKTVLLKSEKMGSFGRYIAEVWIDDNNLSDYLLTEELAKLYIK